MNIDAFYWLEHYAGYDIHLIRNDKWIPPLDEGLGVVNVNDDWESVSTIKSSAPADWSDFDKVEYYAFIDSGYSAPFDGIEIDTSTGKMKADTVSGGGNIHSFIMLAILHVKGGTTSHENYPFMVHVHEEITNLWLTPSPMVIRKGNNPVRFTLLAEFDDGTVGDLSRHPNLTWSATIKSGGAVGTTPDKADFVINADSGAMHIPASSTGFSGLVLDIKVELPAELKKKGSTASLSAMGEVKLEDDWSALNLKPKQLKFGAGNATVEDHQNFLILSDGYQDTAASKTNFNLIASGTAERLRSATATRPWDLLSQSRINYWTCFLPSSVEGISILDEVILIDLPTFKEPDGSTHSNQNRKTKVSTYAYPVWAFVREVDDYLGAKGPLLISGAKYGLRRSSPLPIGFLNLSQLIAKVGLPVPADNPSSGSPMSLSLKITYWQFNYDFNIGVMGGGKDVEQEVYDLWLMLADRYLFNEVDNMLGLAAGSRPNWRRKGSYGSPRPHPFRLNRKGFNQLLNTLQDSGGTIIKDSDNNPRWGHGTAETDKGKDYNNIYCIVGGAPRGGSRSYIGESGDTIVIAGSMNYGHYQEYSNGSSGKQLESVARINATSVNARIHRVFAHESGHNFQLGDEYGGIERAIPKYEETRIRRYKNIQLKSDLLDLGAIKGKNVLWRWLRMDVSTLLQQDPGSSSGDDFILTLPDGYPDKFEVGDKVFLKKQGVYTVVDGDQTPVLGGSPGGPYSPALIVQSGSTVNTLTVKLETQNSDNKTIVEQFKEGDLLMRPIVNTDKGEFEELISEPIRSWIDTHGKDLVVADCKVAADGLKKYMLPDQLDDSNTLLKYKKPGKRKGYKIVGLFPNGAVYDCDVFHPTGSCIMNEDQGLTVQPFCPVCQYILVENIDPQWHDVIDKSYNKVYFKKK